MLINSIPLLEAQASSEIENIVTTADRLFRYAGPQAQALVEVAHRKRARQAREDCTRRIILRSRSLK